MRFPVRGAAAMLFAASVLTFALPARADADDAAGAPEKFVLSDGRSFLGTYSADDSTLTIATANGTLSFALNAGDIASHHPASADELAAQAAAFAAAATVAAAASTPSADAKAARLAKFTALTGLKDYPTLTATQRTAPVAKLPERMLGAWRAVDLIGTDPDQERARLIKLEVDGTSANFSADLDLYHRAAAPRALPIPLPGTAAPGAGAAAARPLPSRIILKAFSCGGGVNPSYLVSNDATGAIGALITCAANDTLVVTTVTRNPFSLQSQDCTVYKVVK